MPRPGSSSDRGYGHAHRKRTALLLAQLVDSTRCPRCPRPMYRNPARNFDGRKLQGDHYALARALGSTQLADTLCHARCNQSAGATLGNRLRGRARHHPPPPDSPSVTSRVW